MANVLEVLQAAGLDVEAEPNWETARGSKWSFDHRPGGTLGMIVHHTAAGGTAEMPCRRICVSGRSSLPGPLVQLLLGRGPSPKLLLISQNRCNHAGRGSSEVVKDLEQRRDITAEFDAGQGAYDARTLGRSSDYRKGNGILWGLEVENDGIGEEYSAAQMKVLVKLCAAMCKWQGWDHNAIIHHREWTDRKIDMSYRGPLRDYVKKAMASNQWKLPKAAAQAAIRPPVTPSKTPGTLERGDKGLEVVQLQKSLTTLGYILVIDGDFGPGTMQAVQRFQKKNGLTPDAKAGKITLSKIKAKQPRPVIEQPEMEYPGHPLRRGSRGPAVRFLQEQIGTKQIDGVFGRGTQRAVRALQSRRRLKVDGVVGRNTWAAITNNK